MAGHILGAYGLASLWLGWLFLRRAEGTLLVWSAIAAAHTRLGTWLFVTLAGRILSFGGHAVMLLGFWAARRRVLEEPQHHLGCCGGRRSWAGDRLAGWAPGGARPHRRAGGPARRRLRARGAAADRRRHRARRRPGIRGPVRPDRLPDPRMGATTSRRGRGGRGGQALALLLPGPLVARRAPAGRLGAGALLGSATMAAFAVGVWLVTVAGAYAMDRAGWRGPAEVLLRRLTYGTAINPPAGKPATRWRGGRGRRGLA